MKCVISGDVIKRVSNEDATKLVKNGGAYCPKWKYKMYKRTGTFEEVVPNVNEEKKVKKSLKSSKRKKKSKS